MTKSIKEFITGKVFYEGQLFWTNTLEGKTVLLMKMKGIGRLENMFTNDEKGLRDSIEYQDKIAHWIAEAINEKLEREQ